MQRNCSTTLVTTVALLALSAPVSRVSAQESLPFTPGQWGIEAAASSNPDGGVIRFFSPKTALTVGGSFVATSNDTDETDPFTGGSFTTKSSQKLADVRLGVRFYRPLAPSVVQFTSVGVVAQHVSIKNTEQFSSTEASVRGTGIGAFSELGAQYHFSTKFSIGAAVRAEYLHSSTRHRNTAEGKGTGNGFALEFAPIRASIFF
jgi:hypothetical protein